MKRRYTSPEAVLRAARRQLGGRVITIDGHPASAIPCYSPTSIWIGGIGWLPGKESMKQSKFPLVCLLPEECISCGEYAQDNHGPQVCDECPTDLSRPACAHRDQSCELCPLRPSRNRAHNPLAWSKECNDYI